jgi:hypothetical protein
MTYDEISKCCAKLEKFFGMIFAYEKPYGNVRKLFACNLKNLWYNVDIRKREKKKEKRE